MSGFNRVASISHRETLICRPRLIQRRNVAMHVVNRLIKTRREKILLEKYINAPAECAKAFLRSQALKLIIVASRMFMSTLLNSHKHSLCIDIDIKWNFIYFYSYSKSEVE